MPANPPIAPLLSPRDVAAWLACSKRKVYKLAGELGAFRVGGELRFDPARVEAYLDAHQEADQAGRD
ncbi:MAG: helix-turn-helix domain-containing protein [Gaiellaceae bacterium]